MPSFIRILTGQPLAAPAIAPDTPILALPKDGSAFDAQINAAIAATIASGRNALKLTEGHVTCLNPILIPSNFSLIGLGRALPNLIGGWYGGVKLDGVYKPGKPTVQFAGSGVGGQSLQGYICNASLENVHCAGFYDNADTYSRRVPAVIDITDGYRLRLVNVSATCDYGTMLRITNTWDSDFWGLGLNCGGTCDPSVTTDSDIVRAYTGRAFLPIETLIGRSLGVPGLEIISPNTDGGDVSNNLRFYSLHYESNGCNGVPLLVYGGNGNNIRFSTGSKIEATEGCGPMIVLQDQSGFEYNGLLYAAGKGRSYAGVGSLPIGTAWNAYTNPGVVLAHGCTSPRFHGAIGYSGGAGTAPLKGFLRFVNSYDPQVNMAVESGLQSLTVDGAARMIFDGCSGVSASHTRCSAYPYICAQPGANTTERQVINGTQTEP